MKKNNIGELLFKKITSVTKLAGAEIIYKILLLFYALESKTTPKWAKTTIISALTYFIVPIDAIPDIAPFIGYSDDLSVIALALSVVYLYIDDNIRAKANSKFKNIFDYEYKESQK